jgi:hypothetical protein
VIAQEPAANQLPCASVASLFSKDLREFRGKECAAIIFFIATAAGRHFTGKAIAASQ